MKMAESSFQCSVNQGFNFEKDAQVLVGHVNSCKIGDQELNSDMSVDNPEEVTGDNVPVFGVLSSVYWNGGYADPVQFTCQVSNENKTLLAKLVHAELSNTEVEYEFTVYDYDPNEKKYYKCFHTSGEKLQGLVYKSGGELAMNIAMDQSGEVVSPKNFTFALGVMPYEEAEQQIHLAFSLSDKLVKKWGIAVTA
jgi:hypothetical protein